ncbi:hypothetical protein DITRI_Ditri02bG0200300 [Diplodiscus trichospermus]
MYNSFNISSSLLSLRSNGSLSFSFNDYSSNLLNSSLDKTPLSSSPCSSCCSSCVCCCTSPRFVNATHILPITPCFLYGLRQSALVHCSPSRRLVLPAGHPCFLRFPRCDLGHAAFEVSTASTFTRKTKARLRCSVSTENNSSHRLGGLDTSEAIISLLSEEMDGDCLVTGERTKSSFNTVEVEKRKNYGSKCYSQMKKREQVDNTRNYGNECNKGRKKRMQVEERGIHGNILLTEKNKNVGSGLLESDSKDEYESNTIESREGSGRNAERVSSLSAENRRRRTKSSSSSYYSLSSSGELENDTQLPEQEEQFLEESFGARSMESIRNENSSTRGPVKVGFKRNNAGGDTVDWDLRKKSEKKLAEVSAEEIQPGAKFSRRVRNDESGYVKRSSSREQLDDKEWEIRKQHSQTTNQVIGQSESRRKSQNIRETSKIHVSDDGETSQKKKFTGGEANVKVSEIRDSAERISTLGRQSESRMNVEEEDTTLVQNQSESRMKTWEEDITMSQSSFQQTRKQQQQRGERIIEQLESEKRSTEAVLMPPQSQVIVGGLLQDDSMTKVSTQEVCVETSKSGSATSDLHSSGRTTFAHHEPHTREMSEIYGESLNLKTHEDSLGSAQRMEESSLQFVGEFVEKARQDILTSEIQQGNKSSDFKSAYEADKHGPNISGQYGKDELKMKKHVSRQSSEGFGAKGPSDEMWDVTDPSVQELPGVETPQGTSTSGHAVIKRSGRSLWSLMADIIRLRWGSRAQTPSSVARSGGRTSPNESVGSETWFSGRELDENSEENLRKERGSMASEVMYQWEQGTQGEVDVSASMRSNERITHLEGNISPSSNILETTSASEGISSTSHKEKHDGSRIEVASSGKEVVKSSPPSPARNIRTSAVVEEISETDKIHIHGGSSIGVTEHTFGARLTEASVSQGKDGELKQRKLQRTAQVPRDRFDEWEEAYTLECEQRKIDEMFMREAILEAKKAAELWEVPVGAILVQHGKIIARGRNLVEELRDSTAHAEMMCIREASSTLRSWRLADTTLYVTLEPCPMCAGAILQARIDTLVWGAPNKLLGADGSWIRLFPDGGGGNDSELTEKPAAPVHPFHPKMTIRRGILASECADIMQQFFQLRRKNKEKNGEQSPSPSCLPIRSHPSKIFSRMHDIFHVMFCL